MESRSESEVPGKQAIGDEEGSSSTCTHFSQKNQNALWTDTGRENSLQMPEWTSFKVMSKQLC